MMAHDKNNLEKNKKPIGIQVEISPFREWNSRTPYEQILQVGAEIPSIPSELGPITNGAAHMCAIFRPCPGDFTSLSGLSLALAFWQMFPRHYFRLKLWARCGRPLREDDQTFADEDYQRGRERLIEQLHEVAGILSRHARRLQIDCGSFLFATAVLVNYVQKWPAQIDLNFDDRGNAEWKKHTAKLDQALNRAQYDLRLRTYLAMDEMILIANAANASEQWALDKLAMRPEGNPPDKSKKSPVTFNPPQITIGGIPYALTDDQALYLDTLIKLGNWMSDPEFRKECPQVGDEARPDRWRKSLPGSVKSHLETKQGKGTRWLA